MRGPRPLATQDLLLNLHLLLITSSASASPFSSLPASFLLSTSRCNCWFSGPQCPDHHPSISHSSTSHQALFRTPLPPLVPFSAYLKPGRPYPIPRATCRPGLALSSLGPSAQCSPAASLSMQSEHPTMASGCRVAWSLANQMLPPHRKESPPPHTHTHTNVTRFPWENSVPADRHR